MLYAAPPPHVVLLGECGTVIAQFAHVPALRDAIQQRDELQRELATLDTADAEEIARVGTAHKAAIAAVLQQSLSEDDYLTLSSRHAALVQEVTVMGLEMADTGEFDAVELLGAKLNVLRKLDVSALPQPSSELHRLSLAETLLCGALAGECDAVIAQFAHVPTFRKAIQHRDELQREYDALKTAATDLMALGRVGRALKAAGAAIMLTEEDYLTLADRHAALVEKVTTTCAELADTGKSQVLSTLASKLEKLKALDVSVLL
jgi:phage host-nuclease inhibitor protein Gam